MLIKNHILVSFNYFEGYVQWTFIISLYLFSILCPSPSPSDVALLLAGVKNSEADRQKLQERTGEFDSQSCLFKPKKVITRFNKISGRKHKSIRQDHATKVKHWYCKERGTTVRLSLGRQDELMTEERKAQVNAQEDVAMTKCR